MAQLPFVLPFDLQGFTFTDARTNPQTRMQVSTALTEFIQSSIPPRDLLCSTAPVRALDRQIARLSAWDASGNRFVEGTPELEIDPQRLAEEDEKSRRIDSVRHTVEIFRGDRDPLNFALTQGGDFVGAWQWYAIRIVSESELRGGLIEIRAGWFPVLLNTTNRQLANRSIDLVDRFVRSSQQLELRDGRFLDIVQATASTVEDSGREDTELIRFARERLERNAGRGQLRLTSRDEASGRKRLRVTDPAVDPIDEPEVDELEQRRQR